jgi:hypothetical protein
MYFDIRQKIEDAMVQSCNDMLRFTDEPSRKFNSEYLFTVNMAKKISRLNGPNADPYKIYLEKATRVFAKDCLAPVILGHPEKRGSTTFRRHTPNIRRNGRVDVAIYIDVPNNGYFGAQPLCAIEVKGFDPQRKRVVDDLKRNLEFHRVRGATGGSVLEFSCLAALHSFRKVEDEDQAKRDIDSVRSKYQRWLAEVGNIDDIDCEIDPFTVSEDRIGRVLDEGEYLALDVDSMHHFVGVIVTFKPKTPPSS